MTKIIGTVTRYRGTEHPHLRGRDVEILTVLKNAGSREPPRVASTDEEIIATGGVTTLDRVVVAAALDSASAGRAAGVVRPIELDYFRELLRGRGTA